MINLKACSRCGGDMMNEEVLDGAELVCLQCGHRTFAPSPYDALLTVSLKRRRQPAAGTA